MRVRSEHLFTLSSFEVIDAKSPIRTMNISPELNLPPGFDQESQYFETIVKL